MKTPATGVRSDYIAMILVVSGAEAAGSWWPSGNAERAVKVLPDPALPSRPWCLTFPTINAVSHKQLELLRAGWMGMTPGTGR